MEVDQNTEEAPLPEPTYLAKLNPHARDARVRVLFTATLHRYYIDDEWRGYRSASGIIDLIFPPFDADRAIDGMMADTKRWNDPIANKKYYGMTRAQIKESWERNRIEAAALGTRMHDNIERALNHLPHDTSTKEWQLYCSYERDHPHLKPYRTEWRVFCKQAKLTGTIDMVYEDLQHPGEYVIADWKRAGSIDTEGFCRCPWNEQLHCKEHAIKGCDAFGNHPLTAYMPNCNLSHYTVQLNIYRWFLTRMYNKRVRELFLVVLHPSQEKYLKVPIPILDKFTGQLVTWYARNNEKLFNNKHH